MRRGLSQCLLAVALAGCIRGLFPVPWPAQDFTTDGWTKLGTASLQSSNRLPLGGSGGETCPCTSSLEPASPSAHRLVLVQVSGEDMSTVQRTLTVQSLEFLLGDGSTVVAKTPLSFSAEAISHIVPLPVEAGVRSVRLVHDGMLPKGEVTLWGR